jgi:hypothetical protein
VVYSIRRADRGEFVLHDVATGNVSVVASGVTDHPLARISPDGSNISYSVVDAGRIRSFVVPSSGGIAKIICENCVPRNWASDTLSH